MFKAYNKVRMHDTDMAGILYFARLFRFAHDALEDLMEIEGIEFDQLFEGGTNYAFVIVHAESDYLSPLKVGDKLEIDLHVAHIGTTSFTVEYIISKIGQEVAGKAKTVHVVVDPTSRKKLEIPAPLRAILTKYSPTNL